MKTIILMTAMFLTVAFAGSVAAADKLVLFNGFYTVVETSQLVDDKVIIDGTGHGNSSLGKFQITYHDEIDTMTGKGEGSSKLTFHNGDTFCASTVETNDITGVDAINVVTKLHFQTSGTGRFASGLGDFSAEHMVDIATGETFASFKGEFLKTTP